MYSTTTEVRVEIEQQIQQITSNRHRSIPIEYIDMAVNRAVINNIKQKLSSKSNYKNEGLDDSTKRVDDFKSLKKTALLNVYVDEDNPNRGFVYLPVDYLHHISSSSYVRYSKFDKSIFDTQINTIMFQRFELNKVNWDDITEGDYIEVALVYYPTMLQSTIIIKDVLSLYGGDSTLVTEFEFINNLISQLLKYNIPACWEYDNMPTLHSPDNRNTLVCFDASNKIMILFISIRDKNGYVKQTLTENDIIKEPNQLIPSKKYTIRKNSLSSSEDIDFEQNSFYSSRNRQISPLVEIEGNRLYVNFGEHFSVQQIYLRYIKKPILFCSKLNQMPDIDYMEEVIETAIADLLLTLKDSAYQSKLQNTTINK